MAKRLNAAEWFACHDAVVCAGAKRMQKWCVREGHNKGPLVAVMLTREVAHALAAAPQLLEALKLARECVAYCRRNHPDAQSGEGVPVEIFLDAAINKAEGTAP